MWIWCDFCFFMKNDVTFKLTSDWPHKLTVFAVLSMIALWVMNVVFLLSMKFELMMILPIVLTLIFTGFVFYLLFMNASARIVGDEIYFKKLFGQEKKYNLINLGYPSSFKLKRRKFITIEMKDVDYSTESFLIIYYNSIFSSEHKDAEQILLSCWHDAQRAKKENRPYSVFSPNV